MNERTTIKSQQIEYAIQTHNVWLLRSLALSNGGLLSDAYRQQAWPMLLLSIMNEGNPHTTTTTTSSSIHHTNTKKHNPTLHSNISDSSSSSNNNNTSTTTNNNITPIPAITMMMNHCYNNKNDSSTTTKQQTISFNTSSCYEEPSSPCSVMFFDQSSSLLSSSFCMKHYDDSGNNEERSSSKNENINTSNNRDDMTKRTKDHIDQNHKIPNIHIHNTSCLQQHHITDDDTYNHPDLSTIYLDVQRLWKKNYHYDDDVTTTTTSLWRYHHYQEILIYVIVQSLQPPQGRKQAPYHYYQGYHIVVHTILTTFLYQPQHNSQNHTDVMILPDSSDWDHTMTTPMSMKFAIQDTISFLQYILQCHHHRNDDSTDTINMPITKRSILFDIVRHDTLQPIVQLLHTLVLPLYYYYIHHHHHHSFKTSTTMTDHNTIWNDHENDMDDTERNTYLISLCIPWIFTLFSTSSNDTSSDRNDDNNHQHNNHISHTRIIDAIFASHPIYFPIYMCVIKLCHYHHNTPMNHHNHIESMIHETIQFMKLYPPHTISNIISWYNTMYHGNIHNNNILTKHPIPPLISPIQKEQHQQPSSIMRQYMNSSTGTTYHPIEIQQLNHRNNGQNHLLTLFTDMYILCMNHTYIYTWIEQKYIVTYHSIRYNYYPSTILCWYYQHTTYKQMITEYIYYQYLYMRYPNVVISMGYYNSYNLVYVLFGNNNRIASILNNICPTMVRSYLRMVRRLTKQQEKWRWWWYHQVRYYCNSIIQCFDAHYDYCQTWMRLLLSSSSSSDVIQNVYIDASKTITIFYKQSIPALLSYYYNHIHKHQSSTTTCLVFMIVVLFLTSVYRWYSC